MRLTGNLPIAFTTPTANRIERFMAVLRANLNICASDAGIGRSWSCWSNRSGRIGRTFAIHCSPTVRCFWPSTASTKLVSKRAPRRWPEVHHLAVGNDQPNMRWIFRNRNYPNPTQPITSHTAKENDQFLAIFRENLNIFAHTASCGNSWLGRGFQGALNSSACLPTRLASLP